jgi:ketosteroid isomerase-like protein
MSSENVKVVERAVAAVNARDVDAYHACCTADIEMTMPTAPIQGSYRGPDAIERFLNDIDDTYPDFHLVLERIDAVGDDRVLAFLHSTGTGRASGVPLQASTANVYDFLDGRIRRVRIFADRQEAIEAAGLTSS